ncbi:MAG: hypothetical protein WC804_21650, partial [Sphingomonas sp.]|uniref:hypothetical protein n=1 Tax=Sphingomonas sp. TaxID=28214 RepID=UPI003569E452
MQSIISQTLPTIIDVIQPLPDALAKHGDPHLMSSRRLPCARCVRHLARDIQYWDLPKSVPRYGRRRPPWREADP